MVKKLKNIISLLIIPKLSSWFRIHNDINTTNQYGCRKALEFRRPASECKCCIAEKNSYLYASTRIYNHLKVENIIIGEHSHIRGELFTFAHGGRIIIGDYCYVSEETRIWSAKEIRIGNRVLISHNVNIFDSDTHPVDDPVARHQQFKDIITTGHPREIDLNEQPVIIEDDVLISCMSIILKGVTIGKAAVVAAGAVVTKDVPPYCVVAGNPAQIVRRIEAEG